MGHLHSSEGDHVALHVAAAATAAVMAQLSHLGLILLWSAGGLVASA